MRYRSQIFNVLLKLKRKIVLCILLCLLLSGNILAQTEKVMNLPKFDLDPYHFGFILGLNQMFFAINPVADFQKLGRLSTPGLIYDSAYLLSVESNPTTGFVIGIVSNLRLGNRFDLRFIPSLSFGEREMVYKIAANNRTDIPDELPPKKVQSTFVEFPLYIRYKGKRINNVMPYILGGGKYAIDLASNAKNKGSATDYAVTLLHNDLYGELGVGFDFYTEWFKFGTEVKMSYGLRDILKHDNTIFTKGIETMKSRLFQLTFTFE